MADPAGTEAPGDWWYGHLTCDLRHHTAPVEPTYWWEGLWRFDLGRSPILLCREAVLEMSDNGIPPEEFVPGELIAPGHWRPVRV